MKNISYMFKGDNGVYGEEIIYKEVNSQLIAKLYLNYFIPEINDSRRVQFLVKSFITEGKYNSSYGKL